MKTRHHKLSVYDDADDFHRWWEAAAKERHPGVQNEFSVPDEYGELNDLLHSAIERAAVYEFGDDARYFAYQNWDWYGPSYECYVNVTSDRLTQELLEAFQKGLVGLLKDWIIVVKVFRNVEDASTEQGEIVIFSDKILLLRETYDATGLAK